MKHRWIRTLWTVVYTILILSTLIVLSFIGKPTEMDNHDGRVNFGEYKTGGIPNPFLVVVSPLDEKTQQLALRAYGILERKFANVTVFNVHITFMDQLKRLSRQNAMPSVKVEFLEISNTRLEYAFGQVITPSHSSLKKLNYTLSLTDLIDDFGISRGLLELQAAIDEAYIRTYFPQFEHLRIRSLPFNQRGNNPEETYLVIVAGIIVALSLLEIMAMLASYIIRDKMSGTRELFCVNGVPRWMVNSSWLISFTLLGLIIALMQLAMIKLPLDFPSIKNVSFPLLFVVLVVYGWTALVFVTFVANVFTGELVAILLLQLYWICSTLAGFTFIGVGLLEKRYTVQCLISILPNFGFAIFLMTLLEFDSADTELSFRNISLSPNMYISADLILLMMMTGILMFLASSLYLDAVSPGPYGRARPWYLFRAKDKFTEKHSDSLPTEMERFFETIDYDKFGVGLNCVDVVKVFGTYKALNNVNLKIIKNKVTVLLGHNGAGKTTLFSILSGMIPPTKGNVLTDEYSVFNDNNIQKFRSVLGYCPQENLVLNELSVQEHLIVFGLLKGLTRSEARLFSDMWTQLFGMYNMRHTQAKNLSGGSKRKLCLAIAMTGKPRYLLLDEPSAGMDIESTQTMIDVILKEKGSCTVVITTHNMDEAETLADYIAILAHGQLKCYGTSSFLKKTIDSGYRLSCSTAIKNTDQVIGWVSKAIRGASVLYKTNRSVTFSLPSSQKSNIPELLRGIEEHFGESVSSSLSIATLDDVFIKFQKDEGVKINLEELPFVPDDEMHQSCWNLTELFTKRVKWVLSKKIVAMVILVILLPNLATIGGMFSLYKLLNPTDPTRSEITSSLDNQRGAFVLLKNYNDDVSDSVRTALSSHGIAFREINERMNDSLIDMAHTNTFEYRSKLLIAFDAQETNGPTAYLPDWTDDTVTMTYSTLINALLQGNATITTHKFPVRNGIDFIDVNVNCPTAYATLIGTTFFVIVGPFFLVASAYFVIFPHEERTTLFKHLQFMTGLQPIAYWLMNLLFDLLVYICGCLLILIIIASMDHMINLFLEPSVLSAFVMALVLYGLSSIIFSYVISFFFQNSVLSIIVLISVTNLTSVAFSVLSMMKKLRFEWSYFIPWTILSNAISKILLWGIKRRDCNQCHYNCDNLETLFAKLKIEFSSFVVLSLVYFAVLLLLDYGLGKKCMALVHRGCYGKIRIPNREVDSEVTMEQKRVEQLKSGDGDYPELVCDGLGKKYSINKTAVYDVTFTVERGECFGLVGVNGAGKSTTFGMLTALLTPSKGTAVIEGRWQVTDCNNYNYLKRVGYCPQYGGLLGNLPARNILKLFGRLNGVRRNQIRPLVDVWITALDMDEIARRPCRHYSGGNKRKLSLAMALIGNPPVVLLDEPTAGVDPVVRRKIWEILTTSLERHERSIILTSHTMSECEAICDRLSIMVNGSMKCLGPIPILKKKYGKSCTLEVKFTAKATSQQQNAVQSKIETRFASIIELQDKQTSRIVFSLKTKDVKLYDMFAAMLKIQSEDAAIEDFNLSETPLEQVFMMFGR